MRSAAVSDRGLPFIRSILAAPSDHRPRLAHAEWLEPSSDPRSAYIRAWVAMREIVDADTNAKPPPEVFDRVTESRRRVVNRHWMSFVEVWRPRNEVDPEETFSGWHGPLSLPTNDVRLNYGPCYICGRFTHMRHWVSRLRCVECNRVFCWECADTGVHGSLPDFESFVTGHFSRAGYCLASDSCPFCQQGDWMSNHGG